MQAYRVEILDDKVLAILQGLEQLRIISLRPLESEQQRPAPEQQPAQHPIMQFKGSIDLGMTREEIDAEITKMREEWR